MSDAEAQDIVVDPEGLMFILQMMVHGYTMTHILSRARTRPDDLGGPIPIDYAQITQLFTEHYAAITEAREAQDTLTMERGLVRTAERIRRLEVYAENIEGKAIKDAQFGNVYVRTIKTIGDIADTSQTHSLPESDEWVQFQRNLKAIPHKSEAPKNLLGSNSSKLAPHIDSKSGS